MEERMRVDKAEEKKMKKAWEEVDKFARWLTDTKKKIEGTMANIKNIKDKTLIEENRVALSKYRDLAKTLNAKHKAAVDNATKVKEGFERMMAARA